MAYRSPWMNEELDMLRDMARKFFETEVVPHQKKWQAQHRIDREVWKKGADLGLLCMSIDEKYGGHGGTFAHECVVMEEQARVGDTSFGFVPGALNAPHFLTGVATEEQRLKWLPEIARGEKVLAVCITEPDAGTDMKEMRTNARREGDEYIINGSKIFITHGNQCDLAIIAARTGGPGAKGISLFMLDRTVNTEGYKVGKVLEKIGQNGLDTCEIFFDDLRVPADNLIGGIEGAGFGHLIQVFIRERLGIGVVGVAAAEAAIAVTLEHVKQRKMFGKTLWDMQNTRFKMAECEAETRAARAFIDALILRTINEDDVTVEEAAMAKYYCSEVQCRVIDQCLQFFGGYGYMSEYPIAQMYMDARVARIYGGSNEILKELVARSL